MSFDFGPMQNLSNVQASHKSCAGGGGNTGYFQRGKKNEEEEGKDIISFSTEKEKEDEFEYIELQEEQSKTVVEILKDFLNKLLNNIKKAFSK